MNAVLCNLYTKGLSKMKRQVLLNALEFRLFGQTWTLSQAEQLRQEPY